MGFWERYNMSDIHSEGVMQYVGHILHRYQFSGRVVSESNKELQNKGRCVDAPLLAWLAL